MRAGREGKGRERVAAYLGRAQRTATDIYRTKMSDYSLYERRISLYDSSE